MKYLIIYLVGVVINFGYFASTADNCYDSVSHSENECKAWYAFPRSFYWPAYWPLSASWYAFDEILGKRE